MNDIIIIGAGGFAREVAWLIEEINEYSEQWNFIGFFDEVSTKRKTLNGYNVYIKDDLDKFKDIFAVCAIGDSEIRKQVVERYKNNFKYATLIHPNVTISNTNKIGEGSIICKGNILTVNIIVKQHVIINLDCTIGHDAILNDFTTILPSVNISGYVVLKECCSIGTGSAVIQNKTIGRNTIVGAGSVVVKDLPEYCVAVGIPARPIKNRKGE